MNFIQMMTKELIDDYEITTKYDAERKAYAIEKLERDMMLESIGKPTDDGLYGKVFELFTHSPNSPITTFRKQNKVDSYITVDGKRRKLEVKTNCGRLGDLYAMPKRSREACYVVYTICRIKPAGKHVRKDGTVAPAEEWYLPPIVMTVADFLDFIDEHKATRIIGHDKYVEDDHEPSVKADNQQFYKAITSRKSTYYERFATYSKSEIL